MNFSRYYREAFDPNIILIENLFYIPSISVFSLFIRLHFFFSMLQYFHVSKEVLNRKDRKKNGI